jgi:hypothetical protein
VRGSWVEINGLVAIVLRTLVLVGNGEEDGGAEMTPFSVPEWMVTRSFSLRGVVMDDWPGRRRLSWGWMSASTMARFGGSCRLCTRRTFRGTRPR